MIGTYLGALVMIVLALWISRDPAGPPSIVLALCGVFVLTVGALGLEGFTALVSGDPVAGFIRVSQPAAALTGPSYGATRPAPCSGSRNDRR